VTHRLKRSSDGGLHVLDVQGFSQILDWPTINGAETVEEFMAGWELSAEREWVWLRDLRRLIDWAERRPEIDSDRLGLIGFSHSAMMAAVLTAVDSRISATALVLGGARPAEVIAHCDGRRTITAQEVANTRFGWDKEELEQRLTPVFAGLNPVDYSGRINPDRVILFEARDDPCIPVDSRRDLWLAMGRPERYTIHSNHRRAFYAMTFLGLNWMQHRVWEFFERQLVVDPSP
jgi:dienelactone hydrolase